MTMHNNPCIDFLLFPLPFIVGGKSGYFGARTTTLKKNVKLKGFFRDLLPPLIFFKPSLCK